jgi:hypothetical protein
MPEIAPVGHDDNERIQPGLKIDDDQQVNENGGKYQSDAQT